MFLRILLLVGGAGFLYFGIAEGLIQGEMTWSGRRRGFERRPVHLTGSDARIMGAILTLAGGGMILFALNPKALRMVKRDEKYWD